VTDYDGFRLERDDARGVATITLDVPGKLNRVSIAARDQLAHLFAELGADEDVRFVVITGAGVAFTAGGDIAGLLETEPERLSGLAFNVARARDDDEADGLVGAELREEVRELVARRNRDPV
jgi:enoyl-CoA hydratase/carnithine racemase